MIGKEYNPTHQQKIGLKIYWAWSPRSEQDPVPPQSVSPIRNFHKPLILIHQRADRKPQSQKTNQTSHGPQPCLTQWNYEPCCVRPLKMDGSWWRVLTKMWSIGEGNGKPLRYSCLENPMNSMKRQKDRTLKDELPGSGGVKICKTCTLKSTKHCQEKLNI